MQSAVHQSLLLWAAKKMTSDGYLLGGYDGPSSRGGFWNNLPVPFELAGVRPDAWGLRRGDAVIGFAEAKTSNDIDNAHTRRQFRVLANARMRATQASCHLYIAIPRSSANALDDVLGELNLLSTAHIHRLHIPEAMIEQE